MAVMPMKRISIYALKNRRKQILELIQRRGVVEIDDRKADETVFAKMDTSRQNQDLKTMQPRCNRR